MSFLFGLTRKNIGIIMSKYQMLKLRYDDSKESVVGELLELITSLSDSGLDRIEQAELTLKIAKLVDEVFEY